MTAPYAQRAITVTFNLGQGSFGGGGFDTVTLAGLRVYAEVSWANLDQQPRAIVRIYGMTLSQINELSVAGLNYAVRQNNKIAIQAGDVGQSLTTVFQGTILEAYPDFSEMPNTAFMVNAVGGADIQLKPVTPTTFQGSASVGTALDQICQKCGLTLENNGVNAVLANPYFPGTGMTQISRAIRAANCFGTLDISAGKLAIWPKLGSRSGDSAVISPNTGMIGYPSFERNFLRVRSIFDPSVYQGPGKKIKVDSQLTAAKGDWTLIQVDLALASETPGGPWEMSIKASPAQTGQ